jgi:hypothetical protein
LKERWLTPGLGPRVLEDEGDHRVGVGEGVGHAGQLVAELLQHPREHRVGAERQVVERVEAALRSQLLQPAQPLRRDAPQRRDADDAELPRAHFVQRLRAGCEGAEAEFILAGLRRIWRLMTSACSEQYVVRTMM